MIWNRDCVDGPSAQEDGIVVRLENSPRESIVQLVIDTAAEIQSEAGLIVCERACHARDRLGETAA